MTKNLVPDVPAQYDDAAFFSHLSWYSPTNKPISTVVSRHDFAEFPIAWHDCIVITVLKTRSPQRMLLKDSKIAENGIAGERGVEQRPAGE